MTQRQDEIASALLAAPAWARVGLTAPSRLIREQAAAELARILVTDERPADHRQLGLPL